MPELYEKPVLTRNAPPAISSSGGGRPFKPALDDNYIFKTRFDEKCAIRYYILQAERLTCGGPAPTTATTVICL